MAYKTIFEKIMERVESKIKIRNVETHSLVRAQVISETRTPTSREQKQSSGVHNVDYNFVVGGFEGVEKTFNHLCGLDPDDLLVTRVFEDMTVRTGNIENEFNRTNQVSQMYQNSKSEIPGMDRDIPGSEHMNVDDFKEDK